MSIWEASLHADIIKQAGKSMKYLGLSYKYPKESFPNQEYARRNSALVCRDEHTQESLSADGESHGVTTAEG